MLEDVKEMVHEHIDERIYLISCGDTYVCEGLFDKVLWKATTSLDHYIFERALALLIAFEDVELVIVGVNDQGQNLYQRTD